MYVIYWPGGPYIGKNCFRIGKNCARSDEHIKTKGTVFPYTDRPGPVKNIFIFPTFASLQGNL